MKKSSAISTALLISLLSCTSCEKIDEYFQNPETEPIVDVLKTSRIIGYVSTVAMNAVAGETGARVQMVRSNPGYPCTVLMLIKPEREASGIFNYGFGKIFVAGMWADENTAIISIVLSRMDIGTSTFTLNNIYTIPIIRELDHFIAIFANMDINLDEEEDDLLKIDFEQGEIDFELARLEEEEAEDIYIALTQNAWIIGIDDNSTPGTVLDDRYFVTGGGQSVTATNTSAGIYQLAMLQVEMDYSCTINPQYGFALLQMVNTEENDLPELGHAILEFQDDCDGSVRVDLATGCYITSIGKDIPFLMD